MQRADAAAPDFAALIPATHEQGLKSAVSARAAVQGRDVVVTSLPDDQTLSGAMFGLDGIIAQMRF